MQAQLVLQEKREFSIVDALARTLISAAPSAVVAFDIDGRVIVLNGPAERLLDVLFEEAMGRSYAQILGPSLADRLTGLFIKSSGTDNSIEPQVLRVSLPGGRRAELRASMGPIRDAAGSLSGFLLVMDELTSTTESQAVLTDRLRRALRIYLGPDIAALVESRPSFVGVGGVKQYVSLLHADVRGYTTVAERLEPEDVATLLLQYHGRVVAALLEEGATLDRFIGDSVLAMWNAPTPCERHSLAAIRGALSMQAAARQVGEELRYGVGVHTGDAVVGNVGNETFLNYTAVGDSVNVAARLQSEAAPGEILCSDRALAEAGESVGATPLGAIKVKGREKAVLAYRVQTIRERESLP